MRTRYHRKSRGKHRSSASRVFNLLYYCLETENTLREGKYMNEECIGYQLVFLTNLKLLINRGNYIFFFNLRACFSIMYVCKATHGKVNTPLHT